MRFNHINRYQPPGAHTWYFDSAAGADANNGAADHPKQTITAVNGLASRAGDRILFGCGGSWSGTSIIPPTSGAWGRPILYGNYGTGALPVFTAAAAAREFRGYGLAGQTRNFLKVSGLDFFGNNSAADGVFMQGHDNEYENIICRSHTNAGLNVISAIVAGEMSYNTFVHGCILHDNTKFGLYAGSGGAGVNGHHHTCIFGNTSYSNGTSTSADHGIYLSDGYQCHVAWNTCYSNKAGGIKLNDQSGASYGGTIVENNYCYSNREGFIQSSNSSIVRNNHFAVNTNSGIYPLVNSGNSYFHNSIINSGYAGIVFLDGLTGAAGNVFKNNLIVQDNAVAADTKCMRVAGDGTAIAASNTFDHNIYYGKNIPTAHVVNRQTGGDLTLADWQAFAGSPDANTQNVDPVVTTEWTDITLQVTSPCIGAAEPVGALNDFRGNPRDPATPDIGCMEYP